MSNRIKDYSFKQIKIVLMTAAVVLIGGFSVSPVLAQTETDQFSIKTEFESALVPLCGGEEVKFSGTVHFKFKSSTTPSGFHQLVHLNYQNMKGIGAVSEDNYNVNEVNNFKVNQNPNGFVAHTVILNKINHLGQGLNSMVFIELQTVLDDEGIAKTTISHVDVRCQGA